MHGIRHSFLPNTSLNHCAPLTLGCSSPDSRCFTPSSADCAIDLAVEFINEAATEAVFIAALCIASCPFVDDDSADNEEEVVLRGSNQSERKSYREMTKIVSNNEQYRQGRLR